MDELDERLEAALPTRTGNELTALTADLAGAADPPLAAAPRARNLARIDHSRGNVTRTGRWVVPRRLEIRLTRGRAKLDFTDADVTGDSVHLDVDLDRGGDLILVIRPGILVDVADLTVSRSNVRIRDRAGCQAPEFLRIELTGRVYRGSIVARFPRRPFWRRAGPSREGPRS